jgi:2-isopropylmalate synthase
LTDIVSRFLINGPPASLQRAVLLPGLTAQRPKEPTMTDKLIIFDTTLRDGEQSPGASMTREEKLRIARQLERLRVDVIEAGFAASSNGDFEAVKVDRRCRSRRRTVCSLARANDRDIARAAEAPAGGPRGRASTPSSPPATCTWRRSCA